MSKSKIFIRVLEYVRSHEKIGKSFEKRDKDKKVTLKTILVRHDRSSQKFHYFRVLADYITLREGFSAKEDFIVEVKYDKQAKDFVGAKFLAVDEISIDVDVNK